MPYPFLLKIAAVTLWRSWRATAVLSFMIVTAVAALVFLSALAVGTNDAMIRNSTGLFSGHIAGSGIRETDVAGLAMPGVKHVVVRRQLPVILRHGSLIEPVALVGIDPEREQEATAFPRKTVAGRYPIAGEAAIYISQDTADRLGLAPGDAVTVADGQGAGLQSLTVSGLYRTGITQFDQGMAFCPTAALPAGAASVSAAIFLDADASLDTIVARYRQDFPAGTFTPWTKFMPDLKQLIDLEYICMAIVITLVFAIVAVGISCSFLIFTLKNLREHGIMKAMGLEAGETALLLLIQIGLLTIAAAALGTLAGTLTTAVFAHSGIDISTFTSHNQYFAVSGILYPRLTGEALLTPPLVAVVFGLAASIWPIVYIIRKNPADILRNF